MAAYGTLYKFYFQSRNGWYFDIIISKLGYAGEMQRRALGRAPLLRRDNNAGIYGTSLEIYAECKVPSEYAQLYTSSAYEYRVEVVRNGQKLWSGFVTPELYEEPDRPAPYDVRIVATDGLGELKRSKFKSEGVRTMREHLQNILDNTGISREMVEVTSLRYDTGTSIVLPYAVLDNLCIDLSHEAENTLYETLQHILASLNASITLHDNRWLLFRETDFIRNASSEGVEAYMDGEPVSLPVAAFGSALSHKWWPIGSMSASVIPACKSIELKSPFHYSKNMLKEWTLYNSALYNDAEKAYVLPSQGAYISQILYFSDDQVQHRLLLSIKARNVGQGEGGQDIGVSILINGTGYSGTRAYWLVKTTDGKYTWLNALGSILIELPAPVESETADDAETIEIVIPLYRKNDRSYMRASSIQVQVFNSGTTYPIYVHDVTLTKYDQAEGLSAEVAIDNGAREEAASVDLQMSDGASIPMGGRWSMTGLPLDSSGQVITQWLIRTDESPADYLTVMAQDYAQKVGGARLRYAGRLNVPEGEQLPCLFVRDNVFYWPRTYSYDLYNDEMEVELISIPDANVEIGINI